MDNAALIWDPKLAEYDLGDGHPLNPMRLKLTVELMEACGLLGEGSVIRPRMARGDELELAHARGYIEAVWEAGDWAATPAPGSGLGTEDNPIYPGMYEVAALTCGATIVGLEEVLLGNHRRTFSIAGGMHHAHKSRAAGFSVFNDAAVAISVARQANPELRVLYLDLDAHHGDGVQECFYGSADVMTISLHQSGVMAFPGTGFPTELGYGSGEGFAVNVPLPPGADDFCFALAFDRVVAPLARTFSPGVIVAQLGVDAHHEDPQTDLGLSLAGYAEIAGRTIALADEVAGGRLAVLGGGGYHVARIVPLAWTNLFAMLSGIGLGEKVPESWRASVRDRLGIEPPSRFTADGAPADPQRGAAALAATEESIVEVRRAVFPFHGLVP